MTEDKLITINRMNFSTRKYSNRMIFKNVDNHSVPRIFTDGM